LQFRSAEHTDLYSLARLWAQSFPGERTISDRVAQLEVGIPYGGIGTAWIAEERGRLAGAFKAYRLTEHLAGALVPMLGLAAVATAPTARRRGVGRALCEQALRLGRERGDLVSVLYPFRPAFYHALGWGSAGELHTFRFAPRALPVYDEAAAVRAAEADDLGALVACYARVAAGSNGLLERDRGVWAYHFDRTGVYPFIYDGNGVSGYVLARFAAGGAPEAGTLSIIELLAEDDDAYLGLLGWIASQGDQFREVRYDARPDEHFGFRLTDPRPPGFQPARNLWYPTARNIRGPMLRILDLPTLLETRTQWGGGGVSDFSCFLEIDDRELPENRGPWTLTLEAGSARIRPGGDPRAAEAALATTAATFAEIFTGTLSPTTAAWLGLARIEGAAAALDRLFTPERPFWLLDEF
jgi:predicted acetyltransferase